MPEVNHLSDVATRLPKLQSGKLMPAHFGWSQVPQTDPLTGLVSFEGFVEWLSTELEGLHDSLSAVGVAVGDVDGLSTLIEGSTPFNGFHGHLAGCAFMRELGQRARHWLQNESDRQTCIATFGGDEIIVVMVHKDGADGTRDRVSRLQAALGEGLPLTVSFAYTTGPVRDFSISESAILLWRILALLDADMLEAKHLGEFSLSRPKFLVATGKDWHE